MTPKIKELRDSLRDRASWRNDMSGISHPLDYFHEGFDAAWALHERLVAPLLKIVEEAGSFNAAPSEALRALDKYKSEVGDE